MKNVSLILALLLYLSFSNIIYLSAQCNNAPAYNDPASQDGILELMQIPCAWTVTNGDPNITVAVFDRYLDNAHTDLVGKVVAINGNCNPADADYHHGIQSFGAVAGVRNNGVCIAGSGGLTTVAGWCQGATDAVLLQAMNDGYKIFSISAWFQSQLTRATMETLTDNGVTVLVAGLNQFHEAADPNGYHSVPGVIHVGRAWQNGGFRTYLNGHPGPNMNMDVLVITQGLDRIADANSCEPSGEGTSLGTPLLAGVVALMMDVNPCLFPSDIEEILVQTAAPANNVATRAGVINAHQAVLMAQNFTGFDQTWTGTETVEFAQVSGDLTIASGADITITGRLKTGGGSIIHIEAGATLTITGTAEMGQSARIYVERGGELIVDGGTLTTGDCATEWKGIRVEGNSNLSQQLPGDPKDNNRNGIVHFLNNALAENARTLVSMDPTHLGWPTVSNHWGGLIVAENTTFQNNKRVAAFMSYSQAENSSFTNCTFTGHENGVTHWNNFGTTYQDCIFDDYEDHGLLVYDGEIIVTGSTFDSDGHTQFDQSAIELFQTLPILDGSQIGIDGENQNQFSNGYHHIYSDGGNPAFTPIIVENNVFNGGSYAISFYGASNHQIVDNTINGSTFGSFFADNGDEPNIQSNNEFNNVGIGIYVSRDNSGYEFLENCFDSWAIDVRVHEGPIVDAVGDGTNAASNLFSQALNPRRISLSGGAQVFDYHILASIPNNNTDRAQPRFYPGNIFDAAFAGNCGPTNFRSTEIIATSRNNENKTQCEVPETKGQIIAQTKQLEKELKNLESKLNGPNENANEKAKLRWEIKGTKRCLHRSKMGLIEKQGKKKDYQTLIEQFKNDKLLYKSAVFGIMAFNKDYGTARDYIKSFSTENEEEQGDFVFTQTMNLDRLENNQYEVNQGQLNRLYKIGLKTKPMSGYSRSLYHLLTGKKIEMELPSIEEIEEAQERSTPKVQAKQFSISPNPTTGQLTVAIPTTREQDARLLITNINGQVVQQILINKDATNLDIDISTENKGIYFLNIYGKENKELLFTEKIVKQ